MSANNYYEYCKKRLCSERKCFSHLQLSDLETTPSGFRWILTISGPPTSPYKNRNYDIEISYESEYPFKAPTFRFLTPIFHPNIQPNGLMSNLMLDCWSFYKNIATIYNDVMEILANPLKEYPYNEEAMLLWETNQVAFKARVNEQPYKDP